METDFEIPQEIVLWYSVTETRFHLYREPKPRLNFGIGVINFGFNVYAATL